MFIKCNMQAHGSWNKILLQERHILEALVNNIWNSKAIQGTLLVLQGQQVNVKAYVLLLKWNSSFFWLWHC